MEAHSQKQATELDSVNKQLFLAVEQKVKLQEELEAWQVFIYLTIPASQPKSVEKLIWMFKLLLVLIFKSYFIWIFFLHEISMINNNLR